MSSSTRSEWLRSMPTYAPLFARCFRPSTSAMSGSSARKTCAPGRNGMVGIFTSPCSSRYPTIRASPEQALVDRALVRRLHRAGVLEVEVALPFQVVQLAEDLAVDLVDRP